MTVHCNDLLPTAGCHYHHLQLHPTFSPLTERAVTLYLQMRSLVFCTPPVLIYSFILIMASSRDSQVCLPFWISPPPHPCFPSCICFSAHILRVCVSPSASVLSGQTQELHVHLLAAYSLSLFKRKVLACSQVQFQ